MKGPPAKNNHHLHSGSGRWAAQDSGCRQLNGNRRSAGVHAGLSPELAFVGVLPGGDEERALRLQGVPGRYSMRPER